MDDDGCSGWKSTFGITYFSFLVDVKKMKILTKVLPKKKKEEIKYIEKVLFRLEVVNNSSGELLYSEGPLECPDDDLVAFACELLKKGQAILEQYLGKYLG